MTVWVRPVDESQPVAPIFWAYSNSCLRNQLDWSAKVGVSLQLENLGLQAECNTAAQTEKANDK